MKAFQSFFDAIHPNSFVSNGNERVSYTELLFRAKHLAYGLRNHGITAQSKVAIVAQPSIEWIICDLACVQAGIITIPLFHNSLDDTLAYQLKDCKPDFLIAGNEEILQKVKNATDYTFKDVFSMQKTSKNNNTIYDLITQGNGCEITTMPIPDHSLPATIIYTSGTSGKPKGVVLTYANFVHQIEDIQYLYPEITNKDTAISILPFAHVFQRTIIYFYLSRGVTIHLVNDIKHTANCLTLIQPSLITVIPRLLEKVYSTIKSQIQAKPQPLQWLLLKIFEYSSKNVIQNKLIRICFDCILFKKVRLVFGKNIKYIVSGGAKLNSNEETFFFNARVPVMQGYGMTECTPVVTSNTKENHKIYTVGKPLPSVEVKIAENGEICIRGGSVFLGYFNGEKRNANDFFNTGDRGSLDSEGFLTVTGRIKEQFKTANGKFVNPVKIEGMINNIPEVENSCVIADGKPYVTAIIFTKAAERDLLQKQIDAINVHLEHHERIQYFCKSEDLPSIENSMVTPSMKLRRNFITERFSEEIEKMYSNTMPK